MQSGFDCVGLVFFKFLCKLRYQKPLHTHIHIQKKAETTRFGFKYIGIYLSSRVVTNQVFSTYMSLTSVFGMGTGGAS